MKIRTLTVGYGRIYSLPDYCNVKPSVTLTADIDGEENIVECLHALELRCERHVHEIIDNALEGHGESPEFYKGPLYRLYRWAQRDDLLVIIPDDRRDMSALPGRWKNADYILSPQRYDAVLARARRQAQDGCYLVIRDEDDLQREVYDWWNERVWYNLWFARVPEGRYNMSSAAALAVRADLNIHGEMARGDYFLQSRRMDSDWPLQLADLERALDETVSADLPRHTLAAQDDLDQFVAAWIEEHGREAEPATTATAAIDNAGYVEDDDTYYEEDEYDEDDYPDDE